MSKVKLSDRICRCEAVLWMVDVIKKLENENASLRIYEKEFKLAAEGCRLRKIISKQYEK